MNNLKELIDRIKGALRVINNIKLYGFGEAVLLARISYRDETDMNEHLLDMILALETLEKFAGVDTEKKILEKYINHITNTDEI